MSIQRAVAECHGRRVPPRTRTRGGNRRQKSPLRLSVVLVALYSVAICFERIIDVEIYKPYRLIGGLLVAAALFAGRPIVDGVAGLGIRYVAIGAVVGLAHIYLRELPAEDLINSVLFWALNLATYVAIASLLRSPREVVLVLVVHAVAMVFASYDILTHAAELAAEGAVTRQSGDFKNPAHACLSMLVAALVLTTLVRRGLADRRHNPLPQAAIVTLGAALVLFELYVSSLTGSRAGAALFVCAAVVYVGVLGRRRAAMLVAAGSVAAALLVTQLDAWPEPLQGNVLVARVESKGFTLDRIYIWRAGIDAFLDTYGLGVGLGQYRSVHQQYFARYAASSDQRWADTGLTLHSDSVSALVEGGTLGFVVFVLLCRRIWTTTSAIRSLDARALGVALIVAAAINGLSHTVLPYFGLWFYLALLSSWARFEASAPTTPVK